MAYRHYAPVAPLLIGLDPYYDVPSDHLARLIEYVVEETVRPDARPSGAGQPPFDPRLCVKVLILGYSTGIRSSRALERLCDESLPYRLLTRGDSPSYRTLCSARLALVEELECAFVGLFAIASELGIKRVGRLTVDATKLRGNASREAVVSAQEYQALREELERILAEAAAVDAKEEAEGRPGDTRLGQPVQPVEPEQMRDILRRVRQEQRRRVEKTDREGKADQEAAESAGASAATVTQPGLFEANDVSEAEVPAAEVPEVGVPAAGVPAAGVPEAGVPEVASGRMYTQVMLARIEVAVEALVQAEKDELKHLCLTDPDARMMGEGREKRLRECHSFEVAVDNGLLVVGQSTQEGNDNRRLPDIITEANKHEPEGVTAVTADSGYYSGDVIAGLVERGIDTCVPDSTTACDLHRGEPIGTSLARRFKENKFVFDPDTNSYTCEAGHRLVLVHERENHGQRVQVYRAKADCKSCALAGQCLSNPNTKHRTLVVGANAVVLLAQKQRFSEPEHQERYRHRPEQVETVFGFLRATLGYTRWLLRGAKRVECEARLFKLAYQFRKVHTAGMQA